MIRTIGDLIAELQKWPASGLVDVSCAHDGIGSGTAVPIHSVDGYAGGAIDGSDSGVSLTIRTLPEWYPADPTRKS